MNITSVYIVTETRERKMRENIERVYEDIERGQDEVILYISDIPLT